MLPSYQQRFNEHVSWHTDRADNELRILLEIDAAEAEIARFYQRRATIESWIRALAFAIGLLMGFGSGFSMAKWLIN